MQLFSLNFSLYTLCGIWRPINRSSSCDKLLYNVFTFYVIVPLYMMVLGQLMDTVLVIDNLDDFIMSSLISTTLIAVCFKATSVLLRRDDIIDVILILLREPCKPRDADEAAIQAKFNKFIRKYTIVYTIMAISSYTSYHIKVIINLIKKGTLPYNMWLPYNLLDSPLVFYITAVQQIIILFFATIINIGTETLVSGLFLHTCVQLEIFELRIHKFVINKTAKLAEEYREYCLDSASHKKAIISEHICHHLLIYKYAKRVNRIFNQVLFVQFFISIFILCMVVYYLTSHIKEPSTASMITYTICMFIQIYMYCWSGNEVILKSTTTRDAIYKTDWPMLFVSDKKDLLMIMKRSTIPIKFTSSFLITLSLESYSSILKTSYSAFNMLQQKN